MVDPAHWNVSFKLNPGCQVHDVLNLVRNFLHDIPEGTGLGMHWFEGSQFVGFFNLDPELDNVYKPLCMLISRLLETDDDSSEMWFCVKGIPIRYSLAEHQIMTGLDCSEYTKSTKEDVDPTSFIERTLPKGGSLRQLKHLMENYIKSRTGGAKGKGGQSKKKRRKTVVYSDEEKTKLAVLYFLCSLVVLPSSSDAALPRLVRILVEDLPLARTYPWGRYSFTEIIHQVKDGNINGKLQQTTPQFIPRCLIIPLMVSLICAFYC